MNNLYVKNTVFAPFSEFGKRMNIRSQGLPECLEVVVVQGRLPGVTLQARNCFIRNSNRRRGHTRQLGYFKSMAFLVHTWPQAVGVCERAKLKNK